VNGETVDGRSVGSWSRHLGRPVDDPRSVREELAGGTLFEAFVAGSAARPEATVRVGDEVIAQVELLGAARRLATVLGGLDANGRAPFVLQAPASLDMVTCYLAALCCGRPVVPLAVTASRDLPRVAADSGAVALITSTDERDPAALLPTLRLGELVARAVSAPERRDGDPPVVRGSDVATIGFTSGTTGRPKGVPLTHRALLASARGVMAAWRWRPDDRLVHALPLTHQHGLSGLHASLLAGSDLTILPKFDPAELAGLLPGATVLFAVPTMYRRLLDHAGAAGVLAGLRLAVSGSAPLAPALSASIADVLGAAPLERYGMTETGLDVSNLLDGPRYPGAVGYALPGLEIAAADTEGRLLGPGEAGELVMRGPQVFDGYLDTAHDAGAFTAGGWFRSGDLGTIGEDGLVTITGRLKELVISGGMNVSPREVELVLERAPGVIEAMAFGRPDDEWGERLEAWVVGGGELDLDAVRAYARAQLAPHACPKAITVVEALPRNAMGKLERPRFS